MLLALHTKETMSQGMQRPLEAREDKENVYSPRASKQEGSPADTLILASETHVEILTCSSGQGAQLTRASSSYSKVTGLIPKHGTYKNQPMNT